MTGEECDGYDLVCVASRSVRRGARASGPAPRWSCSSRPPIPGVFYPDPSPELAHDLVYVANSRDVLRPIVRDLLPTDRDLAIWGANWDGLIDTTYVVAEHVPNDELRKVYTSAKIVLCDHWDDMREHGFISNRIYDALACGAIIVSDDVIGLGERFDGTVSTYRTRDELHQLIVEGLVGANGSRKHHPGNLDAASFSRRTTELLAHVDRTLAAEHNARKPLQATL